jgi:pyruvate kinase
MTLPSLHTKIVATIGPASDSPEMLRQLFMAGVQITRLNFSHGDFTAHADRISKIREAAAATRRRVAILADLPGPKMRLGTIEPGPIEVIAGEMFTLTTENIIGDKTRASMSFEPLPRVVKPGDRLFLNDGLVQLIVERVEGNEVQCRVAVGGTLSSRKGLNLPRIPLGIRAFTPHDRDCLAFALAHGVDAVSQSFVESAQDMQDVREAAAAHGKAPFLIAKIERIEAVERIEEILAAADGIMVARGDLGVEVPIEDMAVIQKRLIALANRAGKPVITATQMLESMTSSRLPTRAEATDVANAILDGTDSVMLSGESAVGRFPLEAVRMLGAIATSAEAHRRTNFRSQDVSDEKAITTNRKAILVEHAIEMAPCEAVMVPTLSGNTARAVARSRPPVWVLAQTPDPAVAQGLVFSAGVFPIDQAEEPDSWNDRVRELMNELGLKGTKVLLVAGPSPRNPHANQRLELIDLSKR